MLSDYDNKMMLAPANKEGILTRNQARDVLNELAAPVVPIHPAFAKRFAAGWKIVPSKCPCGGKWAWLKPRGKGYTLHGCVCHETPEKS
jgi:hypothetical protein